MSFQHKMGIKPPPSVIELGRGADGVVVELMAHSELVLKDMNHPFKIGKNRIALELEILSKVREATQNLNATEVFNQGTDEMQRSWLVRERVFDIWPRGSQEDRENVVDKVLEIYPNADVNRRMLLEPTFDNIRWGYTLRNKTPRWILIDP